MTFIKNKINKQKKKEEGKHDFIETRVLLNNKRLLC